MSMLSKESPQDQTSRVVRVTVLGGDTKDVPFVQGQTVGHFLNEAGITLEDGQGVTLNRLDTTLNAPVDFTDDQQPVILVAACPTLG